MTFLQNRLTLTRFSGMPLTICLAAVSYFVLLYLSTVLDVTQGGKIVRVDDALARFLSDLRTPAIIRFFSIVTAFGYWGVVLALAATVSMLLWLDHMPRYLIGMWVALLGNQISVTLIKATFARARPDLAYYSESSYSFPSGHSAVSAAFFGFLIYLVIRERFASTGTALAIGTPAILAVGMSRLILGEHYLSDVLNGYVVGALWALLGIWLLERGRLIADPPMPPPQSRWRNAAKLAVMAVCVIVVWGLVSHYQHNLPILPAARVAP